jgi:hypothetical protein
MRSDKFQHAKNLGRHTGKLAASKGYPSHSDVRMVRTVVGT